MANATAIVPIGLVRVTDRFRKRSVETLSAATRFYTNALVGTDTTGYLCKGDDTQSWILAGTVRGDQGNPLLPAGTAGDGTIDLDYDQPEEIEITIASVAVTDIGKTVYALFDNEGTFSLSATTYGNVIGKVVDKVAANLARVRLSYDGIAGHVTHQAAKRVAATGTTTLLHWDAGKTIFCANTAAKSIILPAIALVPVGSTIVFSKDHASDTNILTLDGADSEEINGATTFTALDAPYDTVTLISNGTKWITGPKSIA